MPLVTVTCSNEFYPPDREPADQALTDAQRVVVEFVKALPGLIAANAVRLGLDPDKTPEDGVQVDIKSFHSYAVNVPDLWFHVWFAEPYPGETQGFATRDALVEIMTGWLKEQQIELSYALDMFWGPDHGRIVSPLGAIELEW